MSFTLNFDIDAISKQFNEAAADGMEMLAVEIMEESQENVPVLTGELKSSPAIVVDRENLTATLSYKAPHAFLVHEKNKRGKKYLENAFNKHEGRLSIICNENIALAVSGKRWPKASSSKLKSFSWDNYTRPKHSSRRKGKRRDTKKPETPTEE